MTNSTILVSLAFALGAGLCGALLVTRLRQSLVLGYILAGVLIGPFTTGFVGDTSSIQALADIGVIFLLFAIGVQLSFRDLLAVGKVAVVGGGIQVIIMIGIGYLAGIALGWSPIQSLFFGAVISNSSSTVLTKALGERGEEGSEHGRIALAWSSVQDFSTIVLVIILSALTNGSDGVIGDLLLAVAKSALFVTILVVVGSRLLPALFERVAALGIREIFIITVAATALGTAYLSTFFGLSVALGAFAAGIVVGESELSTDILGEVTPLRDIFAALFFVSVGMLANPLFALQSPLLVGLTVLLIVVVKGGLSAVITYLFKYSVRTSVFNGVSLAQCAEFSFLMASVGLALGALSFEVFSLLLTGAAISIVLVPNLYRVVDPLIPWIEDKLAPSGLATHPALADPENEPRGRAVICGYGRVGRVIGATLRRRGFSMVIIDQNQRVVNRLREHEMIALLGNAGNSLLLERANVGRARILVVAIPDALTARQIVCWAQRAYPNLDIVVRVHSQSEYDFMRGRGVGEAVMGEAELALEMTRRTLRRFGVSSLETQAIIQRLRVGVEDTQAQKG